MKQPTLPKPTKTPTFFSRSRSEKFDYFLKGSQSLHMEHLGGMYKDWVIHEPHPLYKIFQILRKNNTEIHFNYDWGPDYERIIIKSYFLDGGLFCASGGGFFESRGVWVKGKKALEFLRDELNLLQQSGQLIAMPFKPRTIKSIKKTSDEA